MKHILYLSIFVLAFSLLYFNLPATVSDKAWFRCTAFEHLAQSFLALLMANHIQNKHIKFVTSITFVFAYSNYIGELHPRPWILATNEIIVAAIALIFLPIKYYYKK